MDCPRSNVIPDGQTLPTPKGIDFTPGSLLGSVSGELGLRKYLESNGHTLVVTSSKDGADSVLDRELPDAEIVISQPFWPAYMTRERIAKAPKLKMIVTAGIGSDHTDLQAAIDRRHHRRRSHLLQQQQRRRACGDDEFCRWSATTSRRTTGSSRAAGTSPTASSVRTIWKGMQVGTVAAGRIGLRVLRLLKPFDVKLHYMDRYRLPEAVEKELNLTHHTTLDTLTKVCDVVTLNCPLHPETEHMINEKSLKNFKRGRLPREHRPGQAVRRERDRRQAVSWPATPATSGSRNRRRRTIRGAPCRITA